MVKCPRCRAQLPYVPIACPSCGKAVGTEDIGVRRAASGRGARSIVPGILVLLLIGAGIFAAVTYGLPALSQATHHTASLSDFAGAAAPPGTPPPIPAAIDNPATRAVAANTVKIIVKGCNPNGFTAGSGWALNATHIATNAHVPAGGNALMVEIPNKPSVIATVVAFDADHDIAVLYAPDAHLTPIPFAATDPYSQALYNIVPVLVVGYPVNEKQTLTTGKLAGSVRRTFNWPHAGSVFLSEVIRTDSAFGHGWSGGPVVNATGTVVGVSRASDGPSSDFAIPPSQFHDFFVANKDATAEVGNGSCDTNSE